MTPLIHIIETKQRAEGMRMLTRCSMINLRHNSGVSRQFAAHLRLPPTSHMSLSSSPRTGRPACLDGILPKRALKQRASYRIYDAPPGSILQILTLPGQICTVIICLIVHVMRLTKIHVTGHWGMVDGQLMLLKSGYLRSPTLGLCSGRRPMA